MREQNRQLRLTEAQLSDPGRIDQIARQLGLDAPQPGQVVRPDGTDAERSGAGAGVHAGAAGQLAVSCQLAVVSGRSLTAFRTLRTDNSQLRTSSTS